ncbi:MAG TPA: ATP-binding protein [Steroidobacteraceae bacterium]|nr:ATP-binding protein [Steroidobacteraceae bacterium]
MTGRSLFVSLVRRTRAWVFAFTILAVTTLVNPSLQQWTDGRAPFLPYFPALVLIALYAGLWPAIVALGLSLTIIGYLWLPPEGWTVGLQSDLTALALFGVASAVVIAVAVRARSLIAAHEQARAAQEAVRESEERLLLALEGAQIGMWSTDLGTGMTRSSDINRALFGLPAGSDEIPSDRMRELIHPDDRDMVVARWSEAFRHRVPYGLEYRIVRPDGSTRWMYSRGRFHQNLDGSLQRIVGISMDVTERKQTEQARAAAEAALRQAKEEFENIFRLAPVGIVVARDRECRVVTANAYVQRMYGVVPGTNISATAPPDVRLPYQVRRDGKVLTIDEMPMQRAASTGRPTVDQLLELTTADGRRTEFVASAVPLLDDRGEPRGAIGALQDVTALRRMEAALRVSEERFRVAQESSLVAFSILKAVRDAAGAIVDFEWEYANKAAARILRRPVTQLVGSRLLTELPGNRHRSPLFETYVEVVETGVARTTQLTYDADGIRGTFLNAASKLGDAVAVWFMDLTERQALIEELRATEASLREADRQKDEFLATLAHELRNPMAPIRYAAAMIRPGSAPEVLERARQMIERQSAQMSRLLDDLLDMSRITRNVIELKRELIDVRQLVEDVVESSRPAVLAERHELGVSMPATPAWIDGDPVRIGQVVHNLVQNAIKYTPAGGRIDVVVAVHAQDVEICVRDTGVGLAPEMLPNVFRLFSQVHPSVHASKGGLGIGLAISRRLVELHGGAIEVRSAGLGRGAEFCVRLPLSAAEMEAQRMRTDAKAVTPPPARRRVLIVDDNIDAADGLALLLRAHGFDVHVAYRGADALSITADVHPDIVLLDLGLPDMPGEDVARRLRQAEWSRSARLIAITGWGQDADRARTREAGFDVHLVKPVDPDVLLGIIGESADATQPG